MNEHYKTHHIPAGMPMMGSLEADMEWHRSWVQQAVIDSHDAGKISRDTAQKLFTDACTKTRIKALAALVEFMRKRGIVPNSPKHRPRAKIKSNPHTPVAWHEADSCMREFETKVMYHYPNIVWRKENGAIAIAHQVFGTRLGKNWKRVLFRVFCLQHIGEDKIFSILLKNRILERLANAENFQQAASDEADKLEYSRSNGNLRNFLKRLGSLDNIENYVLFTFVYAFTNKHHSAMVTAFTNIVSGREHKENKQEKIKPINNDRYIIINRLVESAADIMGELFPSADKKRIQKAIIKGKSDLLSLIKMLADTGQNENYGPFIYDAITNHFNASMLINNLREAGVPSSHMTPPFYKLYAGCENLSPKQYIEKVISAKTNPRIIHASSDPKKSVCEMFNRIGEDPNDVEIVAACLDLLAHTQYPSERQVREAVNRVKRARREKEEKEAMEQAPEVARWLAEHSGDRRFKMHRGWSWLGETDAVWLIQWANRNGACILSRIAHDSDMATYIGLARGPHDEVVGVCARGDGTSVCPDEHACCDRNNKFDEDAWEYFSRPQRLMAALVNPYRYKPLRGACYLANGRLYRWHT